MVRGGMAMTPAVAVGHYTGAKSSVIAGNLGGRNLGGILVWVLVVRFPPDGHNERGFPVGHSDCRARVPHFPMAGKQSQPIVDLLF